MPEKLAAKLTTQGALTGAFVASVLLFIRADQVLPPTPNPPDLMARVGMALLAGLVSALLGAGWGALLAQQLRQMLTGLAPLPAYADLRKRVARRLFLAFLGAMALGMLIIYLLLPQRSTDPVGQAYLLTALLIAFRAESLFKEWYQEQAGDQASA
jgi:multisubunit Na+/H+ antiporter MnhC subunit